MPRILRPVKSLVGGKRVGVPDLEESPFYVLCSFDVVHRFTQFVILNHHFKKVLEYCKEKTSLKIDEFIKSNEAGFEEFEFESMVPLGNALCGILIERVSQDPEKRKIRLIKWVDHYRTWFGSQSNYVRPTFPQMYYNSMLDKMLFRYDVRNPFVDDKNQQNRLAGIKFLTRNSLFWSTLGGNLFTYSPENTKFLPCFVQRAGVAPKTLKVPQVLREICEAREGREPEKWLPTQYFQEGEEDLISALEVQGIDSHGHLKIHINEDKMERTVPNWGDTPDMEWNKDYGFNPGPPE